MKISMSWPGNKKPHKERRAILKPKIRWQQLGFKNVADEPAAISMEEIRRQALILSGRGLRPAGRSPSTAQPGPGDSGRAQGKPGRPKRHGTSEQDNGPARPSPRARR